MEKDIAQFKLSSGSEIVCEVIEWPDEDGSDIIARNIMTIVPYEQEGSVVYGFKPWLHYFESEEDYATISTSHIVASARPNKHLKFNYVESVNDMNDMATQRNAITEGYRSAQRKKIDEILNKIKEGYFGDDLDDYSGDDTLH